MTELTNPQALLDHLESVPPTELNAQLKRIISWSEQGDEAQRQQLLAQLAQRIEAQSLRSGLCALLTQYVAFPEQGVDAFVSSMLDLITSDTQDALEFLEALSELSLPEDVDPDAMDPDELDALKANLQRQLAQQHPRISQRAQRVKHAAGAALGVFERARPALRAARASDAWRAAMEPLAPRLQEARMTLDLFECLDAQPVLFIELDTSQCWRLRVDGVTDLKQLHALLAHTLVEPLEADALSIVDGSGPHFNGSWFQGRWTFYQSSEADTALGADDPLSKLRVTQRAQSPHVVVCARRAQSYESWTLMRTFDMPATVDVLEHITDPDVIESILVGLRG